MFFIVCTFGAVIKMTRQSGEYATEVNAGEDFMPGTLAETQSNQSLAVFWFWSDFCTPLTDC